MWLTVGCYETPTSHKGGRFSVKDFYFQIMKFYEQYPNEDTVNAR